MLDAALVPPSAFLLLRAGEYVNRVQNRLCACCVCDFSSGDRNSKRMSFFSVVATPLVGQVVVVE